MKSIAMIAGALLSFHAVSAKAELLSSYEASMVGGIGLEWNTGIMTSCISSSPSLICSASDPTLFKIPFSATENIGKVFSVSSGSAFNQAVNVLTNGNPYDFYTIRVDTNGWGGGGRQFNDYVLSPGYNGWWMGFSDLKGYKIDKITFSVVSASFASPGSNPNPGATWTDYNVDTLVSVYGSKNENAVSPVPEAPVTQMMLVGLGTLAMIQRRKKKSALPG